MKRIPENSFLSYGTEFRIQGSTTGIKAVKISNVLFLFKNNYVIHTTEPFRTTYYNPEPQVHMKTFKHERSAQEELLLCIVQPHPGLCSNRNKLICFTSFDDWEISGFINKGNEQQVKNLNHGYMVIVKAMKERLQQERIATSNAVNRKANMNNHR